jgi:hypothetical protein
MTITIDRDAWVAGFHAGEAGNPKCPHPPASNLSFSWISGYIEGEAARAKSHRRE